LALSGSGSIASSSILLIGVGSTFDISQSNGALITTLMGSGNVALGSQTLTVTSGGTFSGTIADGGIACMLPAPANCSGGNLTLGGGSGGTLTLSGASTYTGITTIGSNYTLALSGAGSIANTSNVMDNGTFDISQTAIGAIIGSLSGSGAVSIGSKLLVITNGSPLTTFSGQISDGGLGGGTGGTLLVAGGTQTFSGINTYTGATVVNPGATLALSGSGSIAKSSIVDALGTFDISQSNGALITTLMGTGTVALGSQKLTITAGFTNFAGAIVDGGIGGGTGGQLEIKGGTQTLSGTNTYTGSTTIDPGALLALGGSGSIANSANVIDNGTFDISQTSLGATINTLSGAGNVALGAQFLGITAGSTTSLFSGVIADGGIAGGVGGALAISGGTQTLSGVNTYTGTTLIFSGATLALSGSGSIANSVAVMDNGTFDISQVTSGTSIVTLAGTGNVALGAKALTITSASTTFSGVIADGGIGAGTGGSLVVSGGTQTLSGVNTYTGNTTIAPPAGSATLALTGSGSIATSSAVQIATGGTFDISQTSAGASIKTLADFGASPSGNVALGSQMLIITNGSTTFSGVIADGGLGGGTGGSLIVTGGTQTLAGGNTYTGMTAIAPLAGSATLALAGGGSIATSSQVLVATNGTFDISQTIAGASITTLSGAGNVALGGQALTITAGAGVFSGVIADGGINNVPGGSLILSSGFEMLTGVNTYSGGTTVSGGAMLFVNSDAALGKSTGPLTLNNGTLVATADITSSRPITLGGTPVPGVDMFDTNTHTVQLIGNITGTGTLIGAGGGTLTLCGNNTYSGGTIIGFNTTLTTCASANNGNNATLALPNPANLVVLSSTNQPTTVFTGSAHVAGPLDLVNGSTPELFIGPGDTLKGLGAVNVKVTILPGGAVDPGDGAGTLFLNASITNSPGSTSHFAIDGPVNSATNCVNLLGCAGQYSSTIVLGPGNTFTAAGTLAPQLTGIGAPANNTYIPAVTTSFVLVEAQGGVLGSFASITQPAPGVPGVSGGLAAGTRFDALYWPNPTTPFSNSSTWALPPTATTGAITLYVTPASYQNLSYWNISLTNNQNQVAFALDALRGVNDANPALSLPAGLRNNPVVTSDLAALFMQTPAALPHVFDTLSGEANADAAHDAFQMTGQFLQLMVDPSGHGRSGNIGSAAIGFAPENQEAGMPLEIASAYASITRAPRAADFDTRWGAWATTYGGATTMDSNAALGTNGLTDRTYGVAAGMDYRWAPDAIVGVALSGGGSNWGVAQGLGSGRSDAFQAGLYSKTRFGAAYVAASLAFANFGMTTDRYAFTGDHLSASFNGRSYGGRIEAGYRYATPWAGVAPYAAFQAVGFHTPSYSEIDQTGGSLGLFGLNYNSATARDFSSELGARFDSLRFLDNGMQFVLRGRAGWAHEWANNPALTSTFQAALLSPLPGAAPSFVVNGAPLPRNSAVLSLGADLHLTPLITLGAKFDGAFAGNSQTYGGTATLRYSWGASPVWK
jgi:autotransporter-associated beta strand protein